MIYAIIFLFGAVFGSFLNVCIHRLPREQSVVSPGSHCPHCQKPVAWYDNVPLLSYLWLFGKCRRCKQSISPRYAAVEFLNATLWLWLYIVLGFNLAFFAGIILFSILLAITFTDFETGLIPDELSLSGVVAGLLFSLVIPELHAKTLWWQGLIESVLGILGGGGILFLAGWLGNIIFKKDSMGGGDIKLMAMLGAFLGLQKVLFVFFVAPVFALPMALFAKFYQKEETIPFGPYLALSGALFYLYGDEFLKWFYGVS